MIGKIYRKLYLWFLLVFILTIAVVSIMIHGFYNERVREELQGQLQSHAQFLLAEYEEACQARDSRSCGEFLERLRKISPLRFWILSGTGRVRLSNRGTEQPLLREKDLMRARKGEVVLLTRHRAPPYIIVPLRNRSGDVEELAVIERGFLSGRRFPRFPFFASLIIVLITIAVFIYPLSKRLTRPVRELHGLAREWADGRLEKRAAVRGNDEISDLAGTFNTMAESLQKMLQQRKEFFASISHELKSPLARMRIALELLSEKVEGQKEAEELIPRIQLEMLESEKLIEQLLVLSRIEMNIPPIPETVLLQKVTERAIEQMEPLARRAGIHLTYSGSASITGDFNQMERAISNVLENAIKFSEAGASVQVHIEQSNGHAIWKCSDTGSGITHEEVEKIFEPFYRGNGANGKEGTGLGLFIAKRIVEMHAGRIRAEKNQPKGITIAMEFPLKETF